MTQNSTVVAALQIIQIIISVALVIVIILQAKGMGLGSLFGGDAGMGIAKTRRGLEKTLFQVTIILAALFLINSIVQLMIQPAT
ncbi:MAG: preprotein translocase subunit SecG [Aggregatilineales bacterium]